MDHYLTIYSKDYLWPVPLGAGGEAGAARVAPPEFNASPQELAFLQACIRHSRPPDCRCAGAGVDGAAQGQEAGQDWSRNQIMGPLLDPKLFPARVGASPEVSTSRYDQPNAFLDKLESKFPMLYSILQNAPSAELKQRIERDRNKSTYQVDYCEAGPGAEFAMLQRAADVSGSGPCSAPLRLPGDPCRVRPAQRASRNAAFTKNNQSASSSGNSASCASELPVTIPPLSRTEYQDGVSKLGAIIIRDRLHRRPVRGKS